MAKQKRPMTPEHAERLKKIGFQKGKSGNPKGRPPTPEVIKDGLGKLTPMGLEKLENIMLHGKNEMAVLKAIDMILSPFVSKAAQKLDVDVNHTHTIHELLAAANSAQAALAKANVIEAKTIDITPKKDK